LECHSLTSLTSKEVKEKNLNEKQLCMYKLILHKL
jgi:hypothetical protein